MPIIHGVKFSGNIAPKAAKTFTSGGLEEQVEQSSQVIRQTGKGKSSLPFVGDAIRS